MRPYNMMWITACCLLSAAAPVSRADIKNWQTSETIPGTEGIVPAPA